MLANHFLCLAYTWGNKDYTKYTNFYVIAIDSLHFNKVAMLTVIKTTIDS